MYTRSPAAYQALKSFDILQLPCKKSLQGFLSANQSEPGVNEEQIAEQKRLYSAHTAQHVREDKKRPLQKGILIFDEVKVQSKVSVQGLFSQLGIMLVVVFIPLPEIE